MNINNIKIVTNVKISVFVICVDVIIYLLYNLHDCTLTGQVLPDLQYRLLFSCQINLVHRKLLIRNKRWANLSYNKIALFQEICWAGFIFPSNNEDVKNYI